MSKISYLTKFFTSALILSLASGIYLTKGSTLQAQVIDPDTTIEEEVDPDTTIEEIEEIEENPETLEGEQVSVRGEVSEIEPGVAFTIVDDDFFDDEEVIVLNTSGEAVPDMSVYEDTQLQVTGQVGTFIVADIERDYDIDLDDEIYVEYENRPVIFAESLALSPEIEEISENPELYFDQIIAVEGEIENVANDGVFTLEEDELFGSDEILVINNSLDAIPVEGEKVVVTGIVRTLVVSEFERDYDLTWDLDLQEEIEAEYSERPVLVIDQIYPSPED